MCGQPPPPADLQPDVDVAEVQGPPLDQIIKEALSGSNLGLRDKLEGPKTALESMMWPMQIWQSLEVQGLKFFGIDFGVKARQSLFKGLLLTTDYSGIGCPEEAFDKVLLAAKIVAEEKGEEGPVPNAQFRCLRAGDKEGHCRDILLNHGGRFQPECVHGDTLDRCASKSKQRMLEIQKEGPKAVQEGVAASQVLPMPMPAHFPGICIHVAGVNCYDWSGMGGKKKWLGDSVFPFMQWARDRALAKEDVILVECTLAFDSESLRELFEKEYTLEVLRVSPTLFGEPDERQRKYMLLIRKDKLQWCRSVADHGAEKVFYQVFARTFHMLGQEKCRAPQTEVAEHLQDCVQQRHLPPAATALATCKSQWQAMEFLPGFNASTPKQQIST
eukprot:symbB.v1.2.040355.t1/scaffold7167.1/size12942/2